MTSTSARSQGSSNPNPSQAGTGHFMLTLCELAAPVSVRPPQSPRLKSFTFFMSRARQADGSERLYLNMGYFQTLADAEKWLEAVRRHYPNAFATLTPVEMLQPANLTDESLTDTQVLKLLETRGLCAVQDDVDDRAHDQIPLLRPEDTGTRRALREAVAQGAPVFFAVQLRWSAQPIDLNGVPSLTAFKPHTLYATESHRHGRSCYFLRLGFFADPISAKQVAVQVCSTFTSAAVVPVLEQEVMRAREAGMGSSAIPYLGEQRVDRGIESNDTTESSPQSTPLNDAPRRVSSGTEAVGPAVVPPAKRRTLTEDDSLSDSGVRHLRIEVQEHSTGRWRMIRLGAAPSNMVHGDP